VVKIPINDAQSVGENCYIHFTTKNEKFNIQKGIAEQQTRNYNGLELEFDFAITPDAVEVILGSRNRPRNERQRFWVVAL
jgi:hypothetical protein